MKAFAPTGVANDEANQAEIRELRDEIQAVQDRQQDQFSVIAAIACLVAALATWFIAGWLAMRWRSKVAVLLGSSILPIFVGFTMFLAIRGGARGFSSTRFAEDFVELPIAIQALLLVSLMIGALIAAVRIAARRRAEVLGAQSFE